MHLQGHPRDVPGPVPGRELRRQRRRRRHDHLADAALVELRLRAARPDRRHRQGGAAGAPDGDHHAARRGRVDAARHQGGAARSTWPARWRRSPPTACGTGRTTSTASRVPTAQVILEHEADPRRAASVQSARLACEVLEKNVAERHRHPGPDPGPARRRQDRHRAERQRRLVRRLHALPRHRGVDRLARRQRRGGDRRHGITGGSYPAEIWGRYMRAWHEGLEEARVRGARAREPQLVAYLSLDRDNDSGRREAAGRPSSPSRTRRRRRPRSRPVRRPRRPPPRRCPPDTTTTTGRRRWHRWRRRRRHRLILVSAAPGEVRGWRAMTRWDDLLAVQEHDTTDRPAGAPAGAPAEPGRARRGDGRAGRARGRRRRGRGGTPRARARPAAARGRDRHRSTNGRTSTTRRSTAARSATPASSRRCRTRSPRSSGGSPSSRTRSSR